MGDCVSHHGRTISAEQVDAGLGIMEEAFCTTECSQPLYPGLLLWPAAEGVGTGVSDDGATWSPQMRHDGIVPVNALISARGAEEGQILTETISCAALCHLVSQFTCGDRISRQAFSSLITSEIDELRNLLAVFSIWQGLKYLRTFFEGLQPLQNKGERREERNGIWMGDVLGT